MPEQLKFPEFPHREVATHQQLLATPGRLKGAIEVWERDDEPDFVVVTVETMDGDGQLIGHVTTAAVKDEAWVSAINRGAEVLHEMWYDCHPAL